MKILLVSNLFPPDYDGGYEMNAWKLAHGLRRRGADLEVATSRFRPGFAPVAEEPWVHRVFEHRLRRPKPPYGGLREKATTARDILHHESAEKVNGPLFRRFLADRSYDVAYVFGLHDVGLLCARELTARGIPILWHFGDYHIANRKEHFEQSATYRLLAKTLLRPLIESEAKIDLRHAAFVSQFLLDAYREKAVPIQTAYILPRGVEFELGRDVDRSREQPPVILMASRVVAEKGHHVALAAARSLAARRPDLDWRLRIVGSGDEAYLAKLREDAKGLGGRVEFLGQRPRSEVVRMLREATLFLSSSIWGEPFANTIIETLGAGTPLVGSGAGSILEVVEPGRSALIYPKDDPEALSQTLERALDDPALRLSLAQNGLRRIEEAYTMDAILERTEGILADVAREGPPTR